MSLRELLQGHHLAGAAGGIVVRGLALDSRAVQPGDAFIALRGAQADGLAFAPAAIARGAVAVLAEPQQAMSPRKGLDEGSVAQERNAPAEPSSVSTVPTIYIDGLRDRLGAIASHWFGEPSRALRVIGVTGTNGKTSTVQLLAQALHHLGRHAATIGTLGAGLHGAIREGERTTPDVIAVHGLLAQFRDEGATHVAMEVSSHALEQGRVNAVGFELAVFTNLTRDHLDYHGTMDAYGAAKARLFAWPGLSAAIVNVDDAFGRELAARFPPHPRAASQGHRVAAVDPASGEREPAFLLRYGIDNDDADVVAHDVRTDADGLAFRLVTPWGEGDVSTRLLGRFNVSNLLAVVACLGRLGFGFDAIGNALAVLDPVAGRMNRIGGSDSQPLVVVDYAHTPDALEQSLSSLRAHCRGRLVCVFGCGGERDAGKRPQMGAIAERLADAIVVTDDNPRGEDGSAIVAQIVAGLAHPRQATIERDRAGAISLAIAAARPGDIVLIAGKGHEPYQEVAGRKQPFDDLAVARRVLGMRA